MPPSPAPTLPIRALWTFEAAARLGSFKAAADELSVTPAAVSQQVRALEQRLGTPLFQRLNRAVHLTRAGKTLAEATEEGFSRIRSALVELTEAGLVSPREMLSVSVAPSFATKWLAPRLYRFHERHPGTKLRILAENVLVDLGREPGIDVAIRYGIGPQRDTLHADCLWPADEVFPVCAPSLLVDGALSNPADVLKHPLLRSAMPSSPQGFPTGSWSDWLTAACLAGPAAALAANDGLLFGNTQLAIEAAAAGQGIALASAVLVEEDLRAGRLVKPFALAIPVPFKFWLLYRRDRAGEAAIHAFATWILREAALCRTHDGSASSLPE